MTVANFRAEDLVELTGAGDRGGHRIGMRDFCWVVWTPTTAAVPRWARHDHGGLEPRRHSRGTLKHENQAFFRSVTKKSRVL